ncbi:hypothetical protein [Dyadobacter bucti]|uniref:hypothetical protein n=1 Tax=Dyadobacter bucti TaxID=2572203 RepID=UPI003F6E7E27
MKCNTSLVNRLLRANRGIRTLWVTWWQMSRAQLLVLIVSGKEPAWIKANSGRWIGSGFVPSSEEWDT